MQLRTISTKELRENFDLVKRAMAEGQSLLLLYQSQPLAEIRPVQNHHTDTVEEKVKKVRQLAGGFQSGVKLTAQKINKLLDARYEELLS